MFRAHFNMSKRRQRRGWSWWLALLAYPVGILNGYLLSLWQRNRQEQGETTA